MLRNNARRFVWTLAMLAGTTLLLPGCKKDTAAVASGGKRILAEPEVYVPAEPAWYSDLQADERIIYATANAVSPDRQMAEKIAEREARVSLARNVEIMVNGLQRGFEEQLTLAGEYELLQSNQEVAETVTHTTLVGSHVDKKETHLTPRGNYRVFVRMALDRDAVRQRYLDELRRYKELETRLRASDAFQDMERRVEDYQRQQNQRLRNLD